jgi:hypothetical protein
MILLRDTPFVANVKDACGQLIPRSGDLIERMIYRVEYDFWPLSDESLGAKSVLGSSSPVSSERSKSSRTLVAANQPILRRGGPLMIIVTTKQAGNKGIRTGFPASHRGPSRCPTNSPTQAVSLKRGPREKRQALRRASSIRACASCGNLDQCENLLRASPDHGLRYRTPASICSGQCLHSCARRGQRPVSTGSPCWVTGDCQARPQGR